MNHEFVLWGVMNGDKDWEEQVITCTSDMVQLENIKKLATSDGFGRFRTAKIDDMVIDFSKSLN